MDVYQTKSFRRWAKGERLSDREFCHAISEMEEGLIDAVLGGFLVKKRVAAPGRGKSGGYRTIVAYRSRKRAFFLYGFAKNERGNVGPEDLVALRKLAKELFGYTDAQLASAVKTGALLKVKCDE